MRRAEILESVKQLHLTIESSDILETLTQAIKERRQAEQSPTTISVEVLTALKQYTLAAKDFANSTRELAEILKLDSLTEPTTWIALTAGDRATLYEMNGNISFAARYLPRLIELFRTETATIQEQPKYKNMSLINIILIEKEDQFSNPKRFITMLESIQDLYEVSAAILTLPRNDLAVIACDSGSEKSFDLLGLATVVDGVKEIILSLWDRVVFFREIQASERIDLIAQSLPIVKQITDLEKEKALSPEQAEILRRQVITGAQKFLESGAVIPEMQLYSHHNPYQLMSPEVRLLTPPHKISDETSYEDSSTEKSTETKQVRTDSSRLTEKEQAQLRYLMKKLSDQTPPEPDSQETCWHSSKSTVYHNSSLCNTGNNIEEENRVPGTGGKRLCKECERIAKAS